VNRHASHNGPKAEPLPDWARVDRDRPFAPPRRGLGLLPWALALVLVSAALYGMLGGWRDRDAVKPPEPTLETQADAAVSEPGISVRVAPAEPPRVYRCVEAGKVTYTNTACASEDQATVLPFSADTAGRSHIAFYQCRNPAGRLFWSARLCSEHKSRIERTFTVPADLPFPQQVALAEQRLAALKPAPTQRPTRHASAASSDHEKGLICAELEASVKRLDSLARQALSGQRQDEIRSERQRLRDEQFRRRC